MSDDGKRFDWARLADFPAALMIAGMTVWFLAHTSDFGIDDSYITYRYAQNIVLGNGPVFNVGERYLGTTAPGFALLLAALSAIVEAMRIGGAADVLLDIPHLARYISAISAGVIGYVAYRFISAGRPSGQKRVAGVLLACYMITLPQIANTVGHETLFCVALVLAGLYVRPDRPAPGSLLLGIAALVRHDAVLAIVPALAFGELRSLASSIRQAKLGAPGGVWKPVFRRDALRWVVHLALLFAPISAWALFAWGYYGSPIPGTLLAKRAEAFLGSWRNASLATFATYVANTIGALTIPLTAGALLGLAAAMKWRDRIAQVSAWGILHLAFYSLVGTSFWYWYATPLVICLCVAGCHGWMTGAEAIAGAIARRIPSKAVQTAGRLAWSIVLGLAVVAVCANALGRAPAKNAHIRSFDQIVSYLQREAPLGASVSTPEPGALAYSLGPTYHVIDTLGLASPGVAEGILRGELREWPYQAYRPEWILVSYEGLGPDTQSVWFTRSYALVGDFTEPYWSNRGITLRLYRRTS